MATGAGKTYTAVSFIYRPIKYAGAKRVLFLVDRSNLGRQTVTEFQQYVLPDDGRRCVQVGTKKSVRNLIFVRDFMRLTTLLTGQ